MQRQEQHAREYEKKKAHVLVTENAWLGPQAKEGHWFALSRNHHNGAGTWHIGYERRLPKLGITLKPWRKSGGHVLVLPQRGIGENGIAMPKDWTAKITRRLKKFTDRPVKVRLHPGRRPHPPLDFEDCHAVVTWGSGAAIKAIIAGVPVFHDLENWIGAPAARHGLKNIESPYLGDREPMLERLAWAQWSGDEIATGEPFQWLMS